MDIPEKDPPLLLKKVVCAVSSTGSVPIPCSIVADLFQSTTRYFIPDIVPDLG